MDANKVKGAVALIVSQTNYDEQTAKEKLIQWEYNYMNVIKEYLNPNFNIPKKTVQNKSINQRTMSEIRQFMDTANKKYIHRKRVQDEEKFKQEAHKQKIYRQFLNEKKKHPNCEFDPPKINTCKKTCKNPMCPGELSKDNKIYTKDNSKVEMDKNKFADNVDLEIIEEDE